MPRDVYLSKSQLTKLAQILKQSKLAFSDKAAIVQFLHDACIAGQMNPSFNLARFLREAGLRIDDRDWTADQQ